MKHFLKFTYLLLFAVALQNCADDENVTPAKEKVQFTFDLSALDDSGGRVRSSDIPPGTSLFVSIENNTGDSVITMQEVELLHVGGNLISVPLELAPGSYKLTDFLLVNDADEVLFATPRRGSPLAGWVINPLAVDFTVIQNRISNIAMEVLDVSQSAPEDFGYVSFNIRVVKPLKISVLIPRNGGLHLTSAKGYVLHGADTVQSFNLGARVNLISFKQDADVPYTLLVVKNGYAAYTREFIYNDLIAELAGFPLKIILTPAFTMLAYVNTVDSDEFAVAVAGTPGGNITVNWGDGGSNNYVLNDIRVELVHTYTLTGNYYVTVTGDLTDITYFYSFYGQGMIDEINLDQLTELNEIRFGLTRSPRVVDLSHNTKIGYILMPNANNTEIIDLPANNKIRFIDVSGPNEFTTASISGIIDDVHHAAVADNRHNGTFEFAATWWPLTDVMVAAPTPAALAKLAVLRDTYGWDVHPNP